MIIVDVVIPVTGKTYDFSLDENALVETVTEEIVELIVQKEGYAYPETTEFFLLSEKNRVALNIRHSLKENGINTGEHLLLV